jgi:hypothetical protein
MKVKKISYWVLTILFSAMMALSSFFYLSQQPAILQALRQLGYPDYLLKILGTAKLIGVISLVQTRFSGLKEWAYAGFTINLIGAIWSHLAMGQAFITPLVGFLILMGSYILWKQLTGNFLTLNMEKTKLTGI